MSGEGVGGEPDAAKLIRESIRILINTTGTPEYVRVKGKLSPVVLGGYGVTVNRNGWLETPANTDAPTRQINQVIKPGGYFATWCRHNGAEASLRMLNRSAYPSEVTYGFRAQQQSGAAQLAPNQKRARGAIVGMSMAPPLWIVPTGRRFPAPANSSQRDPSHPSQTGAASDQPATTPSPGRNRSIHDRLRRSDRRGEHAVG